MVLANVAHKIKKKPQKGRLHHVWKFQMGGEYMDHNHRHHRHSLPGK